MTPPRTRILLAARGAETSTAVQAVTAAPPRVLREYVVTITRPQPLPITITVPADPAVITVAWPVVRVTGDRPPPAPGVVRLAARPQGPWRLPLPPGHPLRTMAVPPRRR